MQDQFVPYELAVKLKELGFDELCLAFFQGYNKVFTYTYTVGRFKNSQFVDLTSITTPLFQQAFDWFREKHNLGYSIHPITLDAFVTSINNAKLYMLEDNDSYTEARLACLKKLIEIVSK